MIDYEELLLDDKIVPETDREYGSFTAYVEDIASKIPNKWDILKYNKHDASSTCLYFSGIEDRPREFLKYYSWKRLKRDKVGVSSVIGAQTTIKAFLVETNTRYPLTAWHDGYRQAWQEYIGELHIRVREKMLPRIYDEQKFEVRTAKHYAITILRFLAEMASIYEQFSWAYSEDVRTHLPDELRKYFTPQELYELQDEFANLQYRHKTASVPYDELLDIMSAVQKCDKTKHIIARTSIIISFHAGLRISEIRRLNINCLTPINDEEIKEALVFREKHKIDIGGITPDWSNFYWLNYESAKDQKSGTRWSKGTPIMVSQTVYDAVMEVIEYTKELRNHSGSKRLFLVNGNSINPVSITTLYNYKNSFLQEFSLPHFKFHQGRTTFATILYDMDIPPESIQKYLNHISVDITSGYISSNRERDFKAMKSIAGNKSLGAVNKSPTLKAFHEQLMEAFDNEEWNHLSMENQLAVFLFLQKKHNLSISYGDHGFCVLEKGKVCPVKLNDTSPCYQQPCEFYEPETEALPMFVDILNKRKAVKDNYFKACKEIDKPEIAEVKIAKFNRETQSLETLILCLAKDVN